MVQHPTVAKTVLRKLVKAFAPPAIFCRHQHLLVVIPVSGNTLPHCKLRHQLKSLRLPKKLTVQLYCSAELERQKRLGNLFLSTFCIEENCIYQKEETTVTCVWQQWKAKKQTALHHFEQGMKRAKAFYSGACFYWSHDNHPMAAFMLHQATEQCLRAIILSFLGEEVKTHTLPELLQHIKQLLPELGLCLNHPKQQAFLCRLDKAYTGVRYTDQYEITGEELEGMLQLVKQVHVLALHMHHIFATFDV